jgi:murein DD-endopeptidase MepM/ murein hydrolase activator NlpD
MGKIKIFIVLFLCFCFSLPAFESASKKKIYNFPVTSSQETEQLTCFINDPVFPNIVWKADKNIKDNIVKTNDGFTVYVPQGTELHASEAGIVKHIGYNADYGNYIEIQYSFGKVRYGNLQSAFVIKNEQIKADQIIGNTGRTGATSNPVLTITSFLDATTE